MKKRKVFYGIIIACMILILLGPIIENSMSGIFSRTKEDITIYKSLFYDFEYRIIDDVVILKRYVGDDAVVKIPDCIWGYPVKYIGNFCFGENTTIEQVEVPVGVEIIGICAFEGCVNLKQVTSASQSQLMEIGRKAFCDCVSLEKFECGSNIEIIRDNAFKNCANLFSIGEQPNLKTIKEEAFAGSGITDGF